MKFILLALVLLILMPAVDAGEPVRWFHKVEEATAEARKSGKPIFVDVYADWCTWCHKLDKEVYVDPKFASYIKGFVALKVDSEDNKEGTRYAERYKVQGLPTMLVTDADGQVLNRLSGFMMAEEMVGEIDKIQKLLDQEKRSSKKEEINFTLAKEYIDREMYAQAEERFKRVLASATSSSTQKEKAQYSIALAQYYEGRLRTALEILEQYYQTYPNGASNEDALLLLSQLHIETDSNEKALKYLREFMKKYPKSGNAVRAKQVLEALEAECPTC